MGINEVQSKLDPDILRIDLQPIAYKVCRDEGWALDKVDQVELEYRCFLQLIRNNISLNLAPTHSIDLFWHHHILDTQKYMDDCDALFGRYIHHYPYSGIFGDLDAKEQNERLKYTINQIQSMKN